MTRIRFLELVAVMEPGRLPKTDKAAILSDAARILTQLRSESRHLKETIDDLHEKIKELKVRSRKSTTLLFLVIIRIR